MSNISEDKRVFELLAKWINSENESEKVIEKLSNEFWEEWNYVDRIQIREYTLPGGAILMQHILQYSRKKDFFDKLWDEKGGEWDVDDWAEGLGVGGVSNTYDVLKRYYQLIPPYVKVGAKIPNNIKDLYNESRRCYIYGQFSACVALSRAIIEVVAKNELNLNEKGKWTAGVVMEKALERKMISKQVFWLADKVIKRANSILHRAKGATEKNAKNMLDHTKDFLEEMY